MSIHSHENDCKNYSLKICSPLVVVLEDKAVIVFNMQTVRIYHECEVRMEKSIARIAIWHHEACRVMTNGDPEGRIFLSYPHTKNGFFFLLTTVFSYFLFIYLF